MLVAAGLQDGSIVLLDLLHGEIRFRMNCKQEKLSSVETMHYLARQNMLIVCYCNGKAYFWCLRDFVMRFSIQISDVILKICTSDFENTILLVGDSNGRVFLYDIDKLDSKIDVPPPLLRTHHYY